MDPLERAVCQGEDPELWFDDEREAEALEICARCPVREPCLRYAMDQELEFGVWGGTTPEHREALRLPRNLPKLEIVVTTSRASSTGTLCSAGRTPEGQWVSVCRTHCRLAPATSRREAREVLSSPETWCSRCAAR